VALLGGVDIIIFFQAPAPPLADNDFHLEGTKWRGR
jgi:hypothetical protein